MSFTHFTFVLKNQNLVIEIFYLNNIWHRNGSCLSERVSGCPPLLLIFGYNRHNFSLSKRQIVRVLQFKREELSALACSNYKFFSLSQILHSKYRILTFPSKSYFARTFSILFWAGRINGVVSK